MPAPRRLPPALLAALVLAGCSSAPQDPATLPEEGAGAAPAELHLTGCTGFQATTQSLPAGLMPTQPPKGWDPNPDGLVALFLIAFECDRLALGPFERPVRLLVEAHTDAEVPASCRQDSQVRAIDLVLHALWLDDAEVAGYLNATYGLPAATATFQRTASPAGAAQVHTWRWSVPGHAASELSFPDDGGANRNSGIDRLYWARGEGIGGLSLSYDRTTAGLGPVNTPMQGEGTMQEPMLMARLPGALFAGPVQPHRALQADGAFALYRDAQCKGREPAP